MEFNLSEKIRGKNSKHSISNHWILDFEDVKEFVRLLKEELADQYNIPARIDKLAGDKLNGL